MNVLIAIPRYIYRSIPIVPRTSAILGAVLKKHGHQVTVFDSNVMGNFPSFLKKVKPDVVGISCITPTIKKAFKMASVVKKYNKSVYVIFGGIHVTALPEETLKNNNVDIVVRGESESTIPELLKNLKRGKLSAVKGISYRQEGRIRNNPDRPLIRNLDSIPNPDYEILPMEKYMWAYIMTSRGCPYRCIFCSIQVLFGRSVRFRNVNRVVDEIVNGHELMLSTNKRIKTMHESIARMREARSPKNIISVSKKILSFFTDIRSFSDLKEGARKVRNEAIRLLYGVIS